jgi:hypothetical protein
MEYEKARRLLWDLQYAQVQSTKQNGRWSAAKQSKMENMLAQLLAGLMGRAATDEEIERSQCR